MRILVTEASASAPDTLWEALSDPAGWPDWCRAFASVRLEGPFEVGTAVRVTQPGLRPVRWTIDEIVPGRSFRWSSRGPGFTMTSDHVLEPVGPGTKIRFTLTVTGSMSWAVALIAARPTRRYLRWQARDLAGRPNPAA